MIWLLLLAQTTVTGSDILTAESIYSRESWYILAHYYDANSSPTPKLLGPFPSNELCRIAGESTFSYDRRFWTEKKIAEVEAEMKEKKDKRDALIVEMAKTAKRDKNGDATLKLNPCDTTVVDKNNKEVGVNFGCMDGTTTLGRYTPGPDALTGCVTERGAEKAAMDVLKEKQ